MKNLLFIVLSALFLGACGPGVPKQETAKQPALAVAFTPVDVSLNNIDAVKAKAMIYYFRKNKRTDSKPLPTSVHFTRPEIEAIIALLHQEITTEGPTRTDKIDGIRIYFGSNTRMPQGGPLQNTIILVATRAAPNGLHKDEYKHDRTTLAGVRGIRTNNNNGSDGALLYSPCVAGCPDDRTCDWSEPHYYTRKDAEGLINNFGKDTINTDAEWFDLKMFDSMLKYKFDGVRIYFGRHPIDTDHQEISNRDIFVITTTIYDQSNANYVDNFDCVINSSLVNYDLKPNKPEKGVHHAVIPAQDKGELCPVNCTP